MFQPYGTQRHRDPRPCSRRHSTAIVIAIARHFVLLCRCDLPAITIAKPNVQGGSDTWTKHPTHEHATDRQRALSDAEWFARRHPIPVSHAHRQGLLCVHASNCAVIVAVRKICIHKQTQRPKSRCPQKKHDDQLFNLKHKIRMSSATGIE